MDGKAAQLVSLVAVTALCLWASTGSADDKSDGADILPSDAELLDVPGDSSAADGVWADSVAGDVPVGVDARHEDAASPQEFTVYECLVDVQCERVMVAAHRGMHITWPENSLAAIRAAAEAGIALAEVDVRHTADDVLVLMHDDTVDRTTTGSLAQELIAGGDYYQAAMIRDGLATIESMVQLDSELLVMPAVDNVLLLQGALTTIPC